MLPLPLVYRSWLRRTLLISYNSSAPAKPRFRFASHLLAGIAGYYIYYLSCIMKVVDRIQETKFHLEQARNNISKGKFPSQTLGFLRQAVKSYVIFPGSNFVVDATFDVVDDAVNAHANDIVAAAYTKVYDLV